MFQEEQKSETVEFELEEEDDWEPEDEATSAPATYRFDTWDNTFLGKQSSFFNTIVSIVNLLPILTDMNCDLVANAIITLTSYDRNC